LKASQTLGEGLKGMQKDSDSCSVERKKKKSFLGLSEIERMMVVYVYSICVFIGETERESSLKHVPFELSLRH